MRTKATSERLLTKINSQKEGLTNLPVNRARRRASHAFDFVLCWYWTNSQ